LYSWGRTVAFAGYYQDGKLIFAGHLGTGFTIQSGRELGATARCGA
jgi:hypothetical protein